MSADGFQPGGLGNGVQSIYKLAGGEQPVCHLPCPIQGLFPVARGMDGEADGLLTIPVVVEHDVRVHRRCAVLRTSNDEGDVFPVGRKSKFSGRLPIGFPSVIR